MFKDVLIQFFLVIMLAHWGLYMERMGHRRPLLETCAHQPILPHGRYFQGHFGYLIARRETKLSYKRSKTTKRLHITSAFVETGQQILLNPVVRDTAAFVWSVAGSFGLVGGFKYLENKGYIHKVRVGDCFVNAYSPAARHRLSHIRSPPCRL